MMCDPAPEFHNIENVSYTEKVVAGGEYRCDRMQIKRITSTTETAFGSDSRRMKLEPVDVAIAS